MNKRILQIGLLAMVVIGLAGCLREESSDEFEEDIQSLASPISNNDPDRYHGRVMNGKLENALVWLDRDADGQFDDDEPGAFTNAEGRFELDITGFQTGKDEADINPREFPLMATAIPGFTRNGQGDTVDQAFFLLAPPGVELVTPFTTMAETWRRLQGLEVRGENSIEIGEAVSRAGTEINNRLSGTEEAIGVYSDYLVSGAERVPFYARALRRLIQKQVPGDINELVRDLGGAESPDELSSPAIFAKKDLAVIGSILLDQAKPILGEVDEAIQVNGGVDGFQLPELESVRSFNPDLSDPWLLREQRLYLPVDGGDPFTLGDLGEVPDGARQAGASRYDYGLGTVLRRATVRGHVAPSMEFVTRLANESGRMADQGAQLGVGFDLDDPVPGAVDTTDSPDERFLFDWSWSKDGNLASLQSLRFDTVGLGSLADYEPEDADRFYRVSTVEELEENTRISAVERVDGNGNPPDWLIEEPANDGYESTIDFRVYNLSNGQERNRTITGFSECGEPNFSAPNDRVANAKVEVTVKDGNGETVATENYYGHRRESDEPGPRFRVLSVERLPNNGDPTSRWDYEYYDDTSEGLLSEQQPDLLRSLRKTESGFGTYCPDSEGGERDISGTNLDAMITYEHIRFTQYLEQIGAGN
ncbi:hypothetical protein DES49_2787 [Halospina denitrificans]|uniref:Uncharacterized protein n=1 Tax=Halospina denitrificans TaxID=332522 RepID=A0A4R7JJD0_9GAMM|nr:hypothetical protein [Halospina denitrificans]TDT37825.1 hypothetical protein DES49_2787 [Halospina denitrificans]